MGRRLVTTIPTKAENLLHNKEEIQTELLQRQQVQKEYFDRHALKTDLPPLYRGHQVRVQHPTSGLWEPALIENTTRDPRSYNVCQLNGQVVHRNRQQIRELPTAIPDDISDISEPRVPMHTPTPIQQNAMPKTPLSQTDSPVLRTRFGREIRPPKKRRGIENRLH